MARAIPIRAATLLLILTISRPALAGMPSVRLTDAASLRADAISFFLLVFFASAWIVQRIWNWLQKDFTRLPRLSYGKSLAFVTLWGMFFVLILTMISGARELMTPGAWEPNGLTYRLSTGPGSGSDLESRRKTKLIELKYLLFEYARTHDGKFPPNDVVSGIPRSAWRSPDPSGMPYQYFPGHSLGAGADAILVLEPDIFPNPMAISANGDIGAKAGSERRP